VQKKVARIRPGLKHFLWEARDQRFSNILFNPSAAEFCVIFMKTLQRSICNLLFTNHFCFQATHIEANVAKSILRTTQLFLNSLLFATQLFKMEQITRYSVQLHCLLLILESSV